MTKLSDSGPCRKADMPRNWIERKVEDFTGKRFGLWTVTGVEFVRDETKCFVECRCDCGTISMVSVYALAAGKSTACGCTRDSNRVLAATKRGLDSLIGKTFGRWTVAGNIDRKQQKVPCVCSCGTEKSVGIRSLERGTTKSCGCFAREEAFKDRVKISREESSFRALLRRYKKGAEVRKIEFALSDDEFRALVSSNCSYCGAPPSLSVKSSVKSISDVVWNGIDRVNNLFGYTSNNVLPCCRTCNVAKGTMNSLDFIIWANRIGERMKFIRIGDTSRPISNDNSALRWAVQ